MVCQETRGVLGCLQTPFPQTSGLSFPPWSGGLARQLRIPQLETWEATGRLCPKSDTRKLCPIISSSRATRWALPAPLDGAACRGHHHRPPPPMSGGLGPGESRASAGPCPQGWSCLATSPGRGAGCTVERPHWQASIRGWRGLLPGPAPGHVALWSHSRLWLHLCKLSP